jgi:hypothetical protein
VKKEGIKLRREVIQLTRTNEITLPISLHYCIKHFPINTKFFGSQLLSAKGKLTDRFVFIILIVVIIVVTVEIEPRNV